MKNSLINIAIACLVTGVVRAIGWTVFGLSMTYGETVNLSFLAVILCRMTDIHFAMTQRFIVLENKFRRFL